MITFALAASLALIQTPKVAQQRLTLASMFKNGYAVIVREIDINGSGQYVLKQIPQASLGTLWFTTSQNAQLTSVTNTQSETSTSVAVQSIADLLAINIGKKVSLIMNDPKDVVTGTIEVVTGNLVIVKDGGRSTAVERANIRRVISEDSLSNTQTGKSLERGLRFEVETAGAGKIYMISLERGMAWAPGYAVTLLDDKKLRIVGKATAINDLEDINGVETRFITGFPNLPFASIPEPLTMQGNLDQFLAIISGVGAPSYRDSAARGRAGEMMKNQAPAMSGGFDGDFGGSMPISDLGGMQAEDLFFYRQPKVTLKKGERAYYVLFQTDADYNELYTWDIDDYVYDATYRPMPPSPEPEEVWHMLQFKNTSKQPFSTGAATIFKNEQMIGQDMMRYASPGGKAELKITKAMDVSADQLEEEVSRERASLKDRYNNPTHDLVTLKGTLTMENHKKEAVTVRIRKQLTGEVISTTPEGKVVKTARGLRDVNSRAGIEWTQTIEPGKTLTVTYTYKVYIRV